MKCIEDIYHFILVSSYLDGARQYALLMWKSNIDLPIYNLFSSVLNMWPANKLIRLFLDLLQYLIIELLNLMLVVYLTLSVSPKIICLVFTDNVRSTLGKDIVNAIYS